MKKQRLISLPIELDEFAQREGISLSKFLQNKLQEKKNAEETNRGVPYDESATIAPTTVMKAEGN